MSTPAGFVSATPSNKCWTNTGHGDHNGSSVPGPLPLSTSKTPPEKRQEAKEATTRVINHTSLSPNLSLIDRVRLIAKEEGVKGGLCAGVGGAEGVDVEIG